MKRSLWIAMDLLLDASRRPAFVGMTAFTLIFFPVQMGLIDGVTARVPTFPHGMGFRLSLAMTAAWPALTLVGLLAEVLVPARARGELEATLATPITSGELALGWMLPGIALTLIAPPLTYPLVLGAYRLTAGAWPAHPLAELAHFALAAQVATLWVAVPALWALPKSGSGAPFLLRSLAGFWLLLGLDLALGALRLLGHRSLVPAIMVAATIAGVGGALVVGRSLDREGLIGRM